MAKSHFQPGQALSINVRKLDESLGVSMSGQIAGSFVIIVVWGCS